ncbi:MAG TPA: hydrogenase maturation protease [Frankiaceae bacterium]|nr:hydrogenase maturation protease [Frankiaceae bacterium]
MTARVVVIGVGNPFRRDDGAGPAVVRRLAGNVPAHVRLVESDGEPTRLLDAWSGADLAVVVDAVRSDAVHSPGVAAGTVHDVRDPAALLPIAAASSHAVPLTVALDLAAALGRQPARLVVYGIEGADFGDGVGLSPPVARSAAAVAGELADLLAGDTAGRRVAGPHHQDPPGMP